MAHLTTEQRYTISCLLRQGMNQSEIADSIGKHKSVVCREIHRNKDQRSGVYRDQLANRKYASRQKEKRKHRHFTPEVQVFVETLLEACRTFNKKRVKKSNSQDQKLVLSIPLANTVFVLCFFLFLC